MGDYTCYCAADAVERGTQASKFHIRDQTGSLVAPEGPPAAQTRRSSCAMTQPKLLVTETAETQAAQPHPHHAASTTTPTSARGTKHTHKPSAAEPSSEQQKDDSGSESSEPEEPPH